MSSEAAGPGRLVVISGPSGTGKTSICNALLEQLPNAVWSVSATTRAPRRQEASGKSYEFITKEEFDARKARNEFLETAEYCGQQYGTPAAPVKRWVQEGRIVVMEIDVQGGIQVAQSMPDSIRIWVMPPDFESLKSRLEGRKTESAEHMARRLERADGEIAIARDSGAYAHFVTNDVLDSTVEAVIDIVREEMNIHD